MPAYNFVKEFAPMILSGRKPHTIRKRRKRPTKVGDTLYLYTGMRTKACEKIAETPCVDVEPVEIYPFDQRIFVMWTEVKGEALEKLAYADGFDSVEAFFAFFKRYKKTVLTGFELVHWDPEDVVAWNLENGEVQRTFDGEVKDE